MDSEIEKVPEGHAEDHSCCGCCCDDDCICYYPDPVKESEDKENE